MCCVPVNPFLKIVQLTAQRIFSLEAFSLREERGKNTPSTMSHGLEFAFQGSEFYFISAQVLREIEHGQLKQQGIRDTGQVFSHSFHSSDITRKAGKPGRGESYSRVPVEGLISRSPVLSANRTIKPRNQDIQEQERGGKGRVEAGIFLQLTLLCKLGK